VKIGIREKLMAGFGVAIALLLASNGYVLLELHSVSASAERALTTDARTVELAERLHGLLDEEELLVEKSSPASDSAALAQIHGYGLRFTAVLDSLASLIPAQPLFLRPIREIERSHTWLGTHVVFDSTAAAPAPPTRLERKEAVAYIHRTLDQLISYAKDSITVSLAEIGQRTRRSWALALLLMGGTLLAAVVMAFAITRTVTHPIHTLMQGTEHVASGSFAHIAVSSRDEIAQLADAFNAMTDRLSAMNAAKAEMMSNISHEIRTPLQLMLSACYHLLEGNKEPLTDTQRAMILAIRRNVDRIAAFADGFLDLARMEAGMMQYRFTTIDILPLVQRATEEAGIVAAEKHVSVVLKAEPVPPISADGEKIHQVVTNLLGNAVKYTPRAGSITVSVRPSTRGVMIEVSDTGPGIAPEELPKIFVRFYRTAGAAQGRHKGAGLGLALVKGIVDAHGGTVRVASEVGKGSTFTVELPSSPHAAANTA